MTKADLEKKVKDLTKERNDAIREKNETKANADRIIEGLKNQNKVFEETKGSWTTLPFIPQDLGFEEIEKKMEQGPIMRVYHRDGVALTKTSDNLWTVMFESMMMKFKIHSKFEAYHILQAIGIDFSEFL